MAENSELSGSSSRITVEQAEALLRNLGQVVSNLGLYGQQHKATRQALDESFLVLGKMLANQEVVTLGVADERLLCDGHTLEAQTALLRTLVRRLTAAGASSFGLTRGLTRDEFERLVLMIGTSSGGALAQGGMFSTAAQNSDFAHLRVKKISYQAVSEDELVVHKEAVTQFAAQAVDGQAAAAAASTEIIALLQGQAPSGEPALSKEALELAAQPAKLADLLLRAADIRPDKADTMGGEDLGAMVVGCLRRLHHKLATAPAGKTQQGKKNLGRTLVLLEEEVVERLRALMGDTTANAVASLVSKEVDGLVEDLRVDALAEDYLKKRRLIESTEQQLVKFIAAHQDQVERAASLQALEKKLADGGLDRTGWDLLLFKGTEQGRSPGSSSAGSPPLAMLLMRLTDLLDSTKPSGPLTTASEQLNDVVTQLNHGVAETMASVEQKVGKLRDQITTVQPLAGKAKPGEVERQARARKNIITTLAEIVQELRQPLSVINSTIEMLNAGHLGTVPDVQREMLELALQSSRRLGAIVDMLAVISGMPASLQPDAEILECIYQP